MHAAFTSLAERLRPHLAGRRSIWLAGRRGEALLLGPLFKALCAAKHQPGPGWWLSTSEHGMPLHQALDWTGVIPDEIAEQSQPTEEPAQRLTHMLERAEAFARQRKAQRIVFAGHSPTAAAAALCAHARGGGGIWLRPADPAGLIARLQWEGGLERVIKALAPAVETIDVPGVPWWEAPAASEAHNGGAAGIGLAAEIPGYVAERPAVVIAVLRREWGLLDDTLTRLAHALARAARGLENVQFVVLSMLNARLERPLRTLAELPPNLLLAPPLPLPVYRALLGAARAAVTDSPLAAAEALHLGLPLAALGEIAATLPGAAVQMAAITMADVQNDFLAGWLAKIL